MDLKIAGSKFDLILIGAGASGIALLAAMMERIPKGARLAVFEAGRRLATGLAYQTHSSAHLLNVKASLMGLSLENTAEFYHFAQKILPHVGPDDYLPRPLYARYLEEKLKVIKEVAHKRGVLLQFLTEHEVTRFDVRSENEIEIILASGEKVYCQRLCVCSGNTPPPLEIFKTPSPRVFDFYARPELNGLKELPLTNKDLPILILGTGLTMLDALTSLRELGNTQSVILLSRRGLIPQKVAPFTALTTVPSPSELHSALAILQTMRAQGENWRAFIAVLREDTNSIWKNFSSRQQEQFKRHLAPYWEVHRHQAARASYEAFEEYQTNQRLFIQKGRILKITDRPDHLEIVIKERGTHLGKTQSFHALINCSGPVHPSAFKLVQSLQSARQAPNVFSLGPLQRGPHLWEITAMREIRAEAARLSRLLF